jgi:hypothetical protein
MNVELAIVIVCGILNLIPWFLLVYYRPDTPIVEKVQEIDSGLAMIAQALFERLENLEEMASAIGGYQPTDGLSMILNFLRERNSAVNDVYGREIDGTFNGTTKEAEVLPPNDLD